MSDRDLAYRLVTESGTDDEHTRWHSVEHGAWDNSNEYARGYYEVFLDFETGEYWKACYEVHPDYGIDGVISWYEVVPVQKTVFEKKRAK